MVFSVKRFGKPLLPGVLHERGVLVAMVFVQQGWSKLTLLTHILGSWPTDTAITGSLRLQRVGPGVQTSVL